MRLRPESSNKIFILDFEKGKKKDREKRENSIQYLLENAAYRGIFALIPSHACTPLTGGEYINRPPAQSGHMVRNKLHWELS